MSRETEWAVFVARPRRTKGQPLNVARELLDELLDCVGDQEVSGMAVTGSGGAFAAGRVGVKSCNEVQACARAIDRLHPQVRTVIESFWPCFAHTSRTGQ
jgi:activator of 2-hydroxyglutaryl-CoA dehydratase